ncbi:MAG: O-acetyl-ADP-ribose deacetylase [bacterium]|nr:O-acetyl-ADP-ribose deacetylase [bacterium]
MSNARSRIECVRGDLTLERVDAIVNAANEGLRGGGGVDGAIHRAAGPGLLAECIERYPGGCPTGEARITGGHDLAARYVIHAVGPVWRGGGEGEALMLASCFTNALAIAAESGLRTVAFPAISCGVYGYPHDEAARVSIAALVEGLESRPEIEARVVLFSEELLGVFADALG